MVRSWIIPTLITTLSYHGADSFGTSSINRKTRISSSASSTKISAPRKPHEPNDNNDNNNNNTMNRRKALAQTTLTLAQTLALLAYNPPSSLATPPSPLHLSASWASTAGLKSNTENNFESQFVSFDDSSYVAMKEDPTRTPAFERAIAARLQNDPGGIAPKDQVVLDLGTGPLALFAVAAAKAGAGTVYAIEVNPKAAQSARSTVRSLKLESQITILEGFSTEITLPAKADFCIAEIVGSVATEEGAYATLLDAHERHLKEPSLASSWIPSRIQTYGAPASYSLHNLFQPPAFDWGKIKGDPIRFNCRDYGLQLVSDPLLVEDLQFANVKRGSDPVEKKTVVWTVDGDRLVENTSRFRDELRKGGLVRDELEQKAFSTGHSVSGIALWPRVILDADGKIDINTRTYPRGDHQRSHWQTVLPIMSDLPVRVNDGDEVSVQVDFNVPDSVVKAPTYRLEGDVIQKS